MNRKCRICECTDTDACQGSCGWVEDTLCSTCAEIIANLLDYYQICGPDGRRLGTIPAGAAMERLATEFNEQVAALEEDVSDVEPASKIVVVSEFEASTIINQLKANA